MTKRASADENGRAELSARPFLTVETNSANRRSRVRGRLGMGVLVAGRLSASPRVGDCFVFRFCRLSAFKPCCLSLLCYLDGLFVGVEAVGGSGGGDPAVDAVGVAGDADDAAARVQGRERGGNRSCGGVVGAGLDVDEPAGGGQGDLSRRVRDVCVCGQAGRAGGVGAVGGADASPAVDRGVVQGRAGCGGAPVEEFGRRARQGLLFTSVK